MLPQIVFFDVSNLTISYLIEGSLSDWLGELSSGQSLTIYSTRNLARYHDNEAIQGVKRTKGPKWGLVVSISDRSKSRHNLRI